MVSNKCQRLSAHTHIYRSLHCSLVISQSLILSHRLRTSLLRLWGAAKVSWASKSGKNSQSFIHSFNKYLVSIYSMWGAEEPEMGQGPVLPWEAHSQAEMQSKELMVTMVWMNAIMKHGKGVSGQWPEWGEKWSTLGQSGKASCRREHLYTEGWAWVSHVKG